MKLKFVNKNVLINTFQNANDKRIFYLFRKSSIFAASMIIIVIGFNFLLKNRNISIYIQEYIPEIVDNSMQSTNYGLLANDSCNAIYHDINISSLKDFRENFSSSDKSPHGTGLIDGLEDSLYYAILDKNPNFEISSLIWENLDFTKSDIETYISISLNPPLLPDGDYVINKSVLKNKETNEIFAYWIRYIYFIDNYQKSKFFDIIYTKDDFKLLNPITVYYENGQLIMPERKNITEYYNKKVALMRYNLRYQGSGYRILSGIDVDSKFIEETIPNYNILVEQETLMKSLIS